MNTSSLQTTTALRPLFRLRPRVAQPILAVLFHQFAFSVSGASEGAPTDGTRITNHELHATNLVTSLLHCFLASFIGNSMGSAGGESAMASSCG